MMLVSVIINNFNYGRFLGEAIDSVLDQTYSPVELIVVDDGSTDESRAVLQAYIKRFETQCPANHSSSFPPRIIFQANAGQGSAMNTGFAASSGQLIHFLDSDDALHPDAIAEAVSNWSPSAAKIQFPLEVIDESGAPTGIQNPSNTVDRGNLIPQILKKGEYNCPPTTGNIFSRTVLESVLPMDPDQWRSGSDTYLVYQAPFFGSVVAIDHPLAYYRAHSSSASNLSRSGSSALTRLTFLIHLDQKRRKLLESVCAARGLALSKTAVLETWSHLKLRLALARLLDPSALSRRDHVYPVVVRILACLRRSSEVSPRLRIIFGLWSVVLAICPKKFVPRLIRIGFDSVSRGAALTGIGRQPIQAGTPG